MLNICGIVDIGVVRDKNQDKILIKDNVYDIGEYSTQIDENKLIVAVADGVGGQDAGEIASKILLQEFSKIANIINEENYEDQIKKTSDLVYEKLILKANEEEQIKKMGSTLTGAYINEDTITTFNLGDSRTYILKNEMLNQLTKDDSEVQMLIDMGILEENERNFQKNKNIITKFFGTNGEKEYPKIKKQMIKFQKGDILMLCSDGMTDYLQIEEIEKELTLDKNDLCLKARLLINKAINKGSSDNISIILIEKM